MRGRERQLANLVAGLSVQTLLPDEFVVAAMQPEVPVLAAPFPIRTCTVAGEKLPLAAARNAAARAAAGDVLVFLDVDCIPMPPLVARYAEAVAATGGCVMGEVRYLPCVPQPPLDLPALAAIATRHPSKPVPPPAGVVAEPDHGELWGLSFALTRTAFERAGGFDEAYVGYGGEETDFARRLKRAGIGLWRVADALALHQAHAVHIPPLHHFDDILANARRFRHRWNAWPMDYWLGQFAAAGFIDWRADGDTITILRTPTAAEVTASRQPDTTLFS